MLPVELWEPSCTSSSLSVDRKYQKGQSRDINTILLLDLNWINEWMNEFFICKKHMHAIAIKQIYTHVTQWQKAENN